MKKTLLGSVSDDGGTYLWDTNTKRLVHSFDGAHKAPASGLAFSPLNYMLLLSIGLDKKIVCYDVLSKKLDHRCLSGVFVTIVRSRSAMY